MRPLDDKNKMRALSTRLSIITFYLRKYSTNFHKLWYRLLIC